MDGSVPVVLAAYQNNLVTSKTMTSQVVQCLQTKTTPKYDSSLERGKGLKNEGQYLRGVAERMLIHLFTRNSLKKRQKHNGEMNGVGKYFLLMGAQTQEALQY